MLRVVTGAIDQCEQTLLRDVAGPSKAHAPDARHRPEPLPTRGHTVLAVGCKVSFCHTGRERLSRGRSQQALADELGAQYRHLDVREENAWDALMAEIVALYRVFQHPKDWLRFLKGVAAGGFRL